MADIAAADLVYAAVDGYAVASPSDPMKEAKYSITFGDGTDTYPSGGVPLTKGKLGCPTIIQDFSVIEADAADGYVYKYDASAETIRIYQIPALDGNAAAIAPLEELTAATDSVVEATLIVMVKGY